MSFVTLEKKYRIYAEASIVIECWIECSSSLETVDYYLMILSRERLYYYCNLIANPDPASHTSNMELYRLDHFKCDLLSNKKFSNHTMKGCLAKSIQLSERRLQLSCRISLNFHSLPSSRTTLLIFKISAAQNSPGYARTLFYLRYLQA